MLMANSMIKLLDRCFCLVRRYVLEIIILMFAALFFFWVIGYIGNALYGYHFDLTSCWGGFSAIGGAGVLAAVKYCTDSWKNSPEGIMPSDGSLKRFDKNNDGQLSVVELTAALAEKAKEIATGEGIKDNAKS